jgi:hypothetical protein
VLPFDCKLAARTCSMKGLGCEEGLGYLRIKNAVSQAPLGPIPALGWALKISEVLIALSVGVCALYSYHVSCLPYRHDRLWSYFNFKPLKKVSSHFYRSLT